MLAEENFGPNNKIIYSGDTRPCQNFINYAKNCSLLIHEATLETGLEKEAKIKMHTTTKEVFELIDTI